MSPPDSELPLLEFTAVVGSGSGQRQRIAQTWHVLPDTYFTTGDNRSQSCDSCTWGGVTEPNLIGKVVKILRVG